MIRTIEQYAWSNRLRFWHPAEKILPVLILLLATMILPYPAVGPLVISLILVVTVFGAGIPLRIFLRTLVVPTLFIISGTPMLAISVDFTTGIYLPNQQACILIILTVLRTLAATSCLVFIVLTTPLVDWILILKKLNMLSSMADIILLMYRFIFIFTKMLFTGRQAQETRLGYSHFCYSLRSLSLLIAAFFSRCLTQAHRLETGLAARCYSGNLYILETHNSLSWVRLFVNFIIVSLLLVLAYFVSLIDFTYE